MSGMCGICNSEPCECVVITTAEIERVRIRLCELTCPSFSRKGRCATETGKCISPRVTENMARSLIEAYLGN
jgi:hypothetical protein